MLQTRNAPIADTLDLAPGIRFAKARAHEIAGPSRAVLALMAAARLSGPVLWLRPAWSREHLMPEGVGVFIDPSRLLFASCPAPVDLLWGMEEALRSGAVPLVVAELPEPPGLTPVRRLHLAAEAGASRSSAPLAFLLTPDQGGAPGIETRHHISPLPFSPPRWLLRCTRARMAPESTRAIWFENGRVEQEGT